MSLVDLTNNSRCFVELVGSITSECQDGIDVTYLSHLRTVNGSS